MSTAHTAKSPGGAGPYADNQNSNDHDFATGERRRKALSTVTAQLALQGHVVHVGQSGDFVVCKQGLSKYCQDMGALQDFARQIGATNA